MSYTYGRELLYVLYSLRRKLYLGLELYSDWMESATRVGWRTTCRLRRMWHENGNAVKIARLVHGAARIRSPDTLRNFLLAPSQGTN